MGSTVDWWARALGITGTVTGVLGLLIAYCSHKHSLRLYEESREESYRVIPDVVAPRGGRLPHLCIHLAIYGQNPVCVLTAGLVWQCGAQPSTIMFWPENLGPSKIDIDHPHALVCAEPHSLADIDSALGSPDLAFRVDTAMNSGEPVPQLNREQLLPTLREWHGFLSEFYREHNMRPDENYDPAV